MKIKTYDLIERIDKLIHDSELVDNSTNSNITKKELIASGVRFERGKTPRFLPGNQVAKLSRGTKRGNQFTRKKLERILLQALTKLEGDEPRIAAAIARVFKSDPKHLLTLAGKLIPPLQEESKGQQFAPIVIDSSQVVINTTNPNNDKQLSKVNNNNGNNDKQHTNNNKEDIDIL